MSNKEETTSQEMYETILNGRVDFKNSAKNPLTRRQVRYYNPAIDKMQSQNYLEMEDVVVPIILRENNGVLEFAMQYESIPAIKKVLLELPDCPFFEIKKDKYSTAEVAESVADRMDSLDLDMIGLKYLDSSETAVSQSFTDQQAKFVEVYVEEIHENPSLQWFPITSIPEYLRTIGENSSLQTKYALQMFYMKYKEEIDKKGVTEFSYDTDLLGQETSWEDKKTIMEHKYRFGIELSENPQEQEPFVEQYAEYGKSKNSVQCLITRRKDGKIQVGLAKQQRSPFIEREGVDEYFYEAVAGMLEEGETYEDAAEREGKEEAGVEFDKKRLTHLAVPTILSKGTEEYSDFYMYELGVSKILEQSLDEEENISELEWFDLNEIDLSKIHSPLPTKYLIALAKEQYERERNARKLDSRTSDDDAR